MDDLAQQLRAWADMDDMGRGPDPTCLKRRAADHIEALQARIAELEAIMPDLVEGLATIEMVQVNQATSPSGGLDQAPAQEP